MADSGAKQGIFGRGLFDNSRALDMMCDIVDSEDPVADIHEYILESGDPRNSIDVSAGLDAISLGALVTATDCQGEAVDVVRSCITRDLLVQLRARIVHTLYGPNSALMEKWSKDGELDEWREECQVILEKWPH